MFRLLGLSTIAVLITLCAPQNSLSEDACKAGNKVACSKTACSKTACKSSKKATACKKAAACKASKEPTAQKKESTVTQKAEKFSELDSKRTDRGMPGGEYLNDLHATPSTGRALHSR